MADKTKFSGVSDLNMKWVDNGDQTYSPLIATSTSTPSATSGMSYITVSSTAAGDTVVSSASTGQTTRVHRMRLNPAGAVTVTIKSGGTVLETLQFGGSGFLIYDFSSRPWYVTATNQPLVMTTSAAVTVNAVFEFIKG